MPRAFGRFTTTMHQDPDFTGLTARQQAVYFGLGLQPDITAAGILGLTTRRWASMAADLNRDIIEHEIHALADSPGRHLVVDEDTEELLIRKFIKWDEGWKNTQKRLPVVRDAVKVIRSVHIRDIAVEELRRISVGATGSAEQRDAVAHIVSQFDRLRVTFGDHTALGLSPEPEPGDGEPLDDAEPPAMFCPKHMPKGTTESCGPCGTARRMFDNWHERDAQRQIAATEAAVKRRRACRNCNEQGLTEDENGNITGRCTECAPRLSAVGDMNPTAASGAVA